MENVIDIVKESLIESGHDGLFNTDMDCACLLDDLQPCGENFAQCRPGYKHVPEQPEYSYDWHVKSYKQEAI